MRNVKILDSVPMSNSTPEFHFGNIANADVLWVEFEKEDSTVWLGSFGCGETDFSAIFLLNEEAVIISKGEVYLLNIETSILEKKIDLFPVMSSAKINHEEILLIDCEGFHVVGKNGRLDLLKDFYDIIWISKLEENSEFIAGNFDSSLNQYRGINFKLNKSDKKIITEIK